MLKQLLFVLASILIVHDTCAQNSDSIIVLDGVAVHSTRITSFNSGERILQLDSIEGNLGDNLTKLLSATAAITIRSYGVSGLSTLALRGSGGSHTAIFWEGMNIQSPANGTLDLIHLPVGFVDNMSLQHGGGSSKYGSGAIGGTLHLGTALPQFKDKSDISLHQQVGSFGKYYTGINWSISTGSRWMKIRGFRHIAENDFKFENHFTRTKAIETQQNAQINQAGALFEAGFKLNEYNTLEGKYWYQDNLVHIPKTASAGQASLAEQSDEFHRGIVKWHYLPKNNISINAFTGLVYHNLTYDDKQIINSTTQSVNWTTQVEGDMVLPQFARLNIGFNHQYEEVVTENYSDNPSRNRTAIFVSGKKLFWQKVEVNISLRELIYDNRLAPFTPSLGVNYSPFTFLTLKSKIAHSFRLPTFNDLYWSESGASGNPDLKPEEGQNYEFGVLLENKRDWYTGLSEVTGYSNKVNNWILWQDTGGGSWIPENVEDVWARGIEFTTKHRIQFTPNFTTAITFNYSLSKSTKEKVELQSQLHKQLIYTPVHQMNWNTSLIYKRVSLKYHANYVGQQETNADNIGDPLDKYVLHDLVLSYKTNFKKHNVFVSGIIRNIADKSYYVRNAYPMPSRHYQINLVYKFKTIKNQL